MSGITLILDKNSRLYEQKQGGHLLLAALYIKVDF